VPLTETEAIGLADRFYTSPYAVSPPAEVLPFTLEKLEAVRDDLVLELHRKLYQSLPQLRKMETPGLVEMAHNYRKHHHPPYGGERADPNGVLEVELAQYDITHYQEPMYVRDIQDTLYALFAELQLIQRLSGVTFCLMHEGLLGFHRSRRLLPWTTSVTVAVTRPHLMALDGLAGWWENTVANLYIHTSGGDTGKKGAKGSTDAEEVGRVVSKETGVFIKIVLLVAESEFDGGNSNSSSSSSVKVKGASSSAKDVVSFKSRPVHSGPGDGLVEMVSAKEAHLFRAGDIFPMKPVAMHGVLMYVPQNEALVLLQEYGEEPLEANTWGEYTWNLLLQDWILAPNRKLGAKPSSDAME